MTKAADTGIVHVVASHVGPAFSDNAGKVHPSVASGVTAAADAGFFRSSTTKWNAR
jgi:hypothetical protein